MVFGSVAKQRSSAQSDIDLAVLPDGIMDVAVKKSLIEDIALLTGRSVDLVDLTTVGEPLLGEILAHGIIVCGERSMLALVLIHHYSEQMDFLPYRERIIRERRQAWIG